MTSRTQSLKVDRATIGTFKIKLKLDGVSSTDDGSPSTLPPQGLIVGEMHQTPLTDLETSRTRISKLEENGGGLDAFGGEVAVSSTILNLHSWDREGSLATPQPQANTVGLVPNPSTEREKAYRSKLLMPAVLDQIKKLRVKKEELSLESLIF
ncbi:hypothetical protein C8F04DRAFT_1178364 [Mycena alexandri]|uniref:Uncharacterized protein n=1 Tax=Mycena alexandri TaxID=1745969 RepID=A0AAD6X9M4_9AGAR|nr:hypothetical protein C8F04DRAFT_1178364 [Mycena alexandri]